MNATIHFFSPTQGSPEQNGLASIQQERAENTWSQFYFSLVEK